MAYESTIIEINRRAFAFRLMLAAVGAVSVAVVDDAATVAQLRAQIAAAAAAAAAAGATSPAPAPGPSPSTGGYYPYTGPVGRYFPKSTDANVRMVSHANRSQIQGFLDQGLFVVCKENKDYSQGMAGPLKARANGGGMWGIPGFTKLTKGIEFEDGLSNFTFKGFQDASVWHTGTTKVYRDNMIGLGRINIYQMGAMLDRLTIVHSFESQIDFDNSGGGWHRNTRIVHPQWHGGGYGGTAKKACFSMIGLEDLSSYNTVVTGANCLTPGGTSILFRRIGNVALGATDLEIPEGDANDPAIVVDQCGRYFEFGVGGKTVRQAARQINAKEVILLNPALDSGRRAPRMYFTGVESAVIYTGSKSGVVLNLQDDRAPGNNANPRFLFQRVGTRRQALLNNVEVPVLSTDQIAAAVKAFLTDLQSWSRWGRPEYREPGAPLGGTSWQQIRASKPDERAQVQAEIDAADPANGGDGVWYNDRPRWVAGSVFVPKQVAYVGIGPDDCGIVAKTDDFAPVRFKFGGVIGGAAFIDMTIQGGTDAILANEPNTYFVNSYLCGMTFRGQTRSNIFLKDTLAWDNNHYEECNFMDAPVHQRSEGSGTGEQPTVSYQDKQKYWRCQFLFGGRVFDENSARPNNGNVLEDCVIRGMTNGVFKLRDAIEYHLVNTTVEQCSIPGDGVLFDCKGVATYIGLLTRNNRAAYTAYATGYWEGLENVKGSNTGTFFKPTVNNDQRDQVELSFVNGDMGDQPSGFGDGSAADFSLAVANSRFGAAVDAMWNGGVSSITFDTKTDTDQSNNTKSIQSKWVDFVAVPGTRILRNRVA
jgi:hypothetical protein